MLCGGEETERSFSVCGVKALLPLIIAWGNAEMLFEGSAEGVYGGISEKLGDRRNASLILLEKKLGGLHTLGVIILEKGGGGVLFEHV